MAGGDLLSNFPDSILLHILSMLPNNEEVVRTSILSERWRFLWKLVPISLNFKFPSSDNENDTLDYLVSIHRELYYWRSCEKIQKLNVQDLKYVQHFSKDVDLWVHFATKLANVENFGLKFITNTQKYEFPQFLYKNALLKSLFLVRCQLKPFGNVNWSSFVSLSMYNMEFIDGVMEKVLSGFPNMEYLELDEFSGIRRLKISSVKLRELIIRVYKNENHDLGLEFIAPYIEILEIVGWCSKIRIINVASLVTSMICLDFDFYLRKEQYLENETSLIKELLHSVAPVQNLTLGPWCIECLSILELKGWEFPPSGRKFLKLDMEFNQLDYPGICFFLQSSLDLETLVIHWYDVELGYLLSWYTDWDEETRRLEPHNFNGSFPYLKTIKILNFNGCVLPLIKYLLKHAIVLESLTLLLQFKEIIRLRIMLQWHGRS